MNGGFCSCFFYLSVLGLVYYISMCTCVIQPSPKNSIKIAKIEKKKVIHLLIMKKIDGYQSCSREESPYTMYYVPKTRQYTMLTQMKISPYYISETNVYNNK